MYINLKFGHLITLIRKYFHIDMYVCGYHYNKQNLITVCEEQ